MKDELTLYATKSSVLDREGELIRFSVCEFSWFHLD